MITTLKTQNQTENKMCEHGKFLKNRSLREPRKARGKEKILKKSKAKRVFRLWLSWLEKIS